MLIRTNIGASFLGEPSKWVVVLLVSLKNHKNIGVPSKKDEPPTKRKPKRAKGKVLELGPGPPEKKRPHFPVICCTGTPNTKSAHLPIAIEPKWGGPPPGEPLHMVSFTETKWL